MGKGAAFVHRAVVVRAENDAVGRRRLGEFFHFFAQRCDVIAGFAKRVLEFFVAGLRRCKLPLGFEQALLKCTKSCRGVVGHALNLVASRVS